MQIGQAVLNPISKRVKIRSTLLFRQSEAEQLPHLWDMHTLPYIILRTHKSYTAFRAKEDVVKKWWRRNGGLLRGWEMKQGEMGRERTKAGREMRGRELSKEKDREKGAKSLLFMNTIQGKQENVSFYSYF